MEFQFLIGRLKTKKKYQVQKLARDVSIPYRQAQNLDKEAKEKGIEPVFQFLIGRLKTEKIAKIKEALKIVSIPYRQAQNK